MDDYEQPVSSEHASAMEPSTTYENCGTNSAIGEKTEKNPETQYQSLATYSNEETLPNTYQAISRESDNLDYHGYEQVNKTPDYKNVENREKQDEATYYTSSSNTYYNDETLPNTYRAIVALPMDTFSSKKSPDTDKNESVLSPDSVEIDATVYEQIGDSKESRKDKNSLDKNGKGFAWRKIMVITVIIVVSLALIGIAVGLALNLTTDQSDSSSGETGSAQINDTTTMASHQITQTAGSMSDVTTQSVDGVAMTTSAPAFGSWTSWSAWTSCSENCGGGTQQQTRQCQQAEGKVYCEGDSTRNRSCNVFVCPGETCELDQIPDPNIAVPAFSPVCNPTLMGLWHSILSYWDIEDFFTCFIKVKLPSDGQTYRVQAISTMDSLRKTFKRLLLLLNQRVSNCTRDVLGSEVVRAQAI